MSMINWIFDWYNHNGKKYIYWYQNWRLHLMTINLIFTEYEDGHFEAFCNEPQRNLILTTQ